MTMVHPHIRGAYATHKPGTSAHYGSSPHTWGIHSQFYRLALLGRFIPTYVGHTRLSGSRDSGRTVHPHIRGAYATHKPGTSAHYGSSPHTWGIR